MSHQSTQRTCHGCGVHFVTAVLAEFGQFPLQIHFWQQIWRYHHRTVALDDIRLVKLAMLSGCTLINDQAITATADKSWHFHLGCFFEHYRSHFNYCRLIK